MIAGLGIDELHIDPKPAAAEHISYVQLSANSFHIDRFALKREGGIARDDKRAGDAREVCGEVFRYSIDEVFLFGVIANVRKRQNDEGQVRSGGRIRPCTTGLALRSAVSSDGGIDANRVGDVLEALLSYIYEFDVHPAANLIVHRGRDTDAAGFTDTLQPRRNVDAVAKNIIWLGDDIVDIDAYAEEKTERLGVAGRSFANPPLKMDSSANGLYGA